MADEGSSDDDNVEQPAPLPKGWVKCISKKFDRPYYYHEVTKCSIWVHPSLLNPQEETEDEPKRKCFVKVKAMKEGRSASCSSSRGTHYSILDRKRQSFWKFQDLCNESESSTHVVENHNETADNHQFNRQRLRTKCRSSEQSRTNICLSPTGKRLIATSNTHTTKTEMLQNSLKRIYDAYYESEEVEENHEVLSRDNLNHSSTSSCYSKSIKKSIKTTVQPMNPRLKPLLPIPKSASSNRKRPSSSVDSIDKLAEHKKAKVADIKSVTDTHKIPTPAVKAVKSVTDTPAMKAVKSTHKIPTPAMKAVIEARKLANTIIPTISKKAITYKRKANISKEIPIETCSASEITSEPACQKKKKKKNKSGKSKQEQCSHNEECGVINDISRNSNTTMASLKPLKPTKNKLEVHVESKSSLISNLKTPTNVYKKTERNSKAYLNLNKNQNINTRTCNNSRNSIISPNSTNCNVYSNFHDRQREKEKYSSTIENDGGIQQNSSDLSKCLQPETVTSDYCDQVEDMEVDDAVEFGNEILKEIQELREENIIEKPEVIAMEQTNNLPVYSDLLYIVLDTNVLLGHLKFISELKDYRIPGVGTPILMVPWMVLQELDSLKDAANRYHVTKNKDGIEETSQKLSYLARQAINFIGNCLDGDHPRLKGESAIEAGTPITGFIEETNDDSIIHCGLGLKIRAVSSHIVILSNDRNLCNKAIVVGIKAFPQKNIILGLKNLFNKNGACTFVAEKEDSKGHVNVDAKKRKHADELFCELQRILRDGCSKVIEDEMISAYGKDLWLSIVRIKPPWTLQDVFILLEKHWIAVFGNIVNRQLIKQIIELKGKCSLGKSSPVEFELIKKMLQQSSEILSDFAKHSDYNGMLTKCIAEIRLLIQHTHDEKQISSSHTLSQPPVKTIDSPTKSGDTLPNINNENQQITHLKVRETFDEIWNAVNYFSSLIFYSLNFPSPLLKDLPANQEKPPAHESLTNLSIMAPCLSNIIKGMQNVISLSTHDLSNSQQIFINLLESIYLFTKEIMKQDCTITPEELLLFCQDSDTRNVLVQGLSQLDRVYAMLHQCVEYHQSSDCN